jgi:ribosomal protein S1
MMNFFPLVKIKHIFFAVIQRHLFDKNGPDNDDDDENDDDVDEATNSDKASLTKAKNDPKNMNKEELERLFPLNASLRARIYDINLIEDIILLSIRPSVIDATFMAYSELKVGQVIKCTVRSINPNNGGVNVKISDFVSGFIPKIHTSDVPLSEILLPRKMKPGAEIKCRILQLDSEGKRCVLTAKNTLVKSKLSLLDSFDQIQYGMETYGVVVSVQKYGLLLSFFNDLKGLLPRNQISTSLEVLSETTDLKKLFYIGQVTKCKVFEFNREKQQLKLSLIMGDVHLESYKRSNQIDSDTEMDTALTKKKSKKNKSSQPLSSTAVNAEDSSSDYKVGELIESASILQVNEENSYFRVKLPKGSTNGIIYKNHLSDFECLNDILFECYKRSMKLNNLMITRYASDVTIIKSQSETANQHKMCHYLTLKTTLIDRYTKMQTNEIAQSFSDLKANEWYYGWIKKTLATGVLVEMPHNLIGFTSNQELDSNNLSIGQSCLIKIAKLYEDKKQFTTSVRTRHNLLQKHSVEADFMVKLFKSLLLNTKSIFDQLNSNSNLDKIEPTNSLIHPNSLANKQQWEKSAKKIQIGNVVKVAVKSYNKITNQLSCLFLFDSNTIDNDLQGIAFATDKNVNYEEGTKLDALVLAFDPLTRVFCLMIDSKQIKIYKKNFDPKFRSQLVCKSDQVNINEKFCF